MHDFYQTHFFYAKSYSTKQLHGKPITHIGSCSPLKYSDGVIIYPCGLIVNTFVQDEFGISGNDVPIPISTTGIAWNSTNDRIKNTEYNFDEIVAPPLCQPYTSVPKLGDNERFVTWMSTASFLSFRKLYGKIDDGLAPGTYNLNVNSSFPCGRKSIVLAESSWAGVSNYFLAIYLIAVGAIIIGVSSLLWTFKSNLN